MTKSKLPWRDHLTAEEREMIEAGDRATAAARMANAARAGIVNRAIQRAKYREGQKA